MHGSKENQTSIGTNNFVLVDLSYFQFENKYRKKATVDDESDPTNIEAVLKKGEEFFKLGDFQSSCNIYTFGIEDIR